MCGKSEANRELTLSRDTLEMLLLNFRTHLTHAEVVVGFTQTLCQLLLTSSEHHSKQFTRALVDCVLDGRRMHPGHATVHVWTLTFLHNATTLSDDHRVYISRFADGLALLLETRDRRLRQLLPIGDLSGPGQATGDLCLEVTPSRIPQY